MTKKYPLHPARHQRGLSLIELLVSLTIGLVILTAIGTAYINTTNTTKQREDQAQLNDPARDVMRVLKQNLTQAGYVDIFDLDATNRAQAASLFVPGDPVRANMFIRVPAAAPLQAPIGQFFPGLTPVFGCDGAMGSDPNSILTSPPPAASACGAASATRHTLQIAYQGIPNNAANATNSLIPADATTGDGLDCLQRTPPAGEVMVINRFSAPAPAAGAVSQLNCEGSGAVGAQSLAAGVEEFVLRYQMSAPGTAANPIAAGGGQQRYLSAADVTASAQGWAAVTAVEICIVSATPTTSGPAAQGTVALQPTRPTCTRDANGAFDANIARAAGDSRLWKRYTSVVSVRNAIFATPL
jgi:type IV pilus assembly protein PilW